MSCKLNTPILVSFTVLGIGLGIAVGGPVQATKAGCPNCQSASAASGDTGPRTAPSKSDQELIEKQKTCPVTDALLGSMGTPVKVQVKGRTVFLCCAGCKAKLLKNPDKYLEKLDKQNKK
jgi:YHS domain-containing protein